MQHRIDIDQLLQPRRRIARQRNKTYARILELAHRRIRYNVLQRPECDWCVFTIPRFVAGLPRFNIDTCTRYCLAKLRTNGFDITFVPPYTILISWDRYVKSTRRKAQRARARERRAARSNNSKGVLTVVSHSRIRGTSSSSKDVIKQVTHKNYLDVPAPRASWRRRDPARPPCVRS